MLVLRQLIGVVVSQKIFTGLQTDSIFDKRHLLITRRAARRTPPFCQTGFFFEPVFGKERAVSEPVTRFCIRIILDSSGRAHQAHLGHAVDLTWPGHHRICAEPPDLIDCSCAL
jgi:hypothetical protein